MEARGVEVADASGKIMVGTIPGPDGRPIPIFRDIETGEGQIGFDDPGPGAKLFRKGLEAPPRAILRGADAVLNNPAMDALATVPPGQPVTGEPRVDRALSVLQVIREGFNRLFKSPPPP